MRSERWYILMRVRLNQNALWVLQSTRAQRLCTTYSRLERPHSSIQDSRHLADTRARSMNWGEPSNVGRFLFRTRTKCSGQGYADAALPSSNAFSFLGGRRYREREDCRVEGLRQVVEEADVSRTRRLALRGLWILHFLMRV